MTNPSLNPEKNAARNQKVLAQLANAIASSKGEFKLILAIAEGTSVCERLGLKLLERCKATQDLVIDPIELPSEISTVSENLEGAIEAWESAEEKPDALMILGIKFLENQEQFWVILNQARDRLRDVFKLPVVLWLDQASLKQMLAVANDLNSWATSKRFQTELTDHNADLELGLDELFESLNETDAEDVVLGLERVISEAEWQELMVAHAELMVAGVGIAPKLEAGVVFGRGRSGLHFDNPSSVLAHFERSRDRLQGIADAENWLGWVEWHRGVAKLLLLEERFKQSETLDLVGVLSEVKACFKTAIAFWEQDEDSLLSEIAQEWETHLLVTYRLLAARAQTSGHLEEEVQYLEYFECVSPFCFPQLALDGLRRLETVLLREKRDYLEAFKVGRHRREVERVYGVRSFIGVARLVPLRVEGKTETVPPEIEFSGRAEDLETIIDRIRGNDTKLVVLCGASGVGKSSLVNAGLLPRIPRETFEDGRVGVAIDLRQYDHWARDLRREIGERVKALGLDPCGEGVDDASAIQADLRGIAGKHREIVVVLDQFEEFFFANPDPVEQRQFFEVLGGLFGDVELGALTVVLSLRSDFLHLLLPCNQMASMGAIGGDILGRRVLYELGNLSPERAERMWQRLAPQMEEGLRRRVVDDLAAELGVVRPIELQIVGARLETLGIRDLAGYEQLEGASKDVLVQGYVDEIVEACGSGRELAQVVLFLLTDEGQGRPIKSRQELATELAQLGRETEQLGLVLEILVASDLVVTDPQLENHFRLVHDYVAELMRKTQGTKLQDELAREREARQLAQASLVELESRISIAKSELQRVDDELARAKNITRLEKDCRFSLRQFAIHEELEALLGAAHATSQLQSVVGDAPLGDYPTTEPIYATNEILRQICTQNTLKGHSNGVLSASFSPDGSTIVSASYDQTVKLWDAKTGEELRTLKGHSTLVKSANFSPDGSTIVSASYDQTVKLWDAKTGRELHTLKGHSDGVLSANFSPDGSTIVSTSHDRTVKLWNAKTGRELRTLKGHSNWVRSANFSPDGTIIVSASRDETVKLWDAKTGKELRTLKVLKRHSSGVWSANFSPDGTIIVSASDDQTVKLWDAKTGEELRTLKGHSRGVLSANFSPDGSTIVSASDDQTVKLWDAKTGEGLRTLKGHSRGVLSANFSPDGGTIVSASSDQRVKLWDAKTGEELRTLKGRSSGVSSANFSPDGSTIVSASSEQIVKLWDAKTGKELRTLKGRSSGVSSANFSPDGSTIASTSYDKTVQLWDAKTGEELRTLRGHSSLVLSANFSPDGSTIVSASSDQTMKLWDAETGEELRTLKGHSAWVSSANFSPDGSTIVSVSDDQTVKLWDAKTGEELRTLQGHSDRVRSANFSPDGSTIVSASDDQTVKLWDAKTGEELRTLQGHSGRVRSANFSPDGSTIVSASDDQTVKLWKVETLENLLARACGWLTPYLTSSPDVTDKDRALCGLPPRDAPDG